MYDTHTHALYLYIIKTLNNTWTNLLAICLSKTYRTIPAVISIFQRNVAIEIPAGSGEFNHHVGVKVLIWLVRFRVSVYKWYNDIWFLLKCPCFLEFNPIFAETSLFFGGSTHHGQNHHGLQGPGTQTHPTTGTDPGSGALHPHPTWGEKTGPFTAIFHQGGKEIATNIAT